MSIAAFLVDGAAALCVFWGMILVMKGLLEQPQRREQEVSVLVDIFQFLVGFGLFWAAFYVSEVM